MKKIAAIVMFLIPLILQAQKDSTAKLKDTIYLKDFSDTIQVPILFYLGDDGNVKYTKPGYKIFKGQISRGKSGGWTWSDTPALAGGLMSDRKKFVKALNF